MASAIVFGKNPNCLSREEIKLSIARGIQAIMPPQDGDSIGDSNLGTKLLKTSMGKGLSEGISKLIITTDIEDN